MKFPEKIFPNNLRKAPLVNSVVASLFVVVCFYFIDKGIVATSGHPDMVVVYGEYLSLAKWLIVIGLLVRGIIGGFSQGRS